MAESQKKVSSSVSSKEKDSLLADLDIGNDFFSSWKPMSMADADGMDFDLKPGNKKSFHFDKADIDFNLDGDFGKMPSFNMDMSDLDISPPLKKDGQPKEKPKESSGGKNKDKTDQFSFAFDFDELDNFNFDSSLPKEGPKDHKDKSKKESPPGRSECQDEEGAEHMKQIENTSTSEDGPHMPSRPGTVMTFDMDSLVGGGADLEPIQENRPSVAINEVASNDAKRWPKTTVASWELPEAGESEKSFSAESVGLEACTGNDIMEDWSHDSLSNNEPTEVNSSEAKDEVDSANTNANENATGSNRKQDVNAISADDSSCHYKRTISENSEKSNGEKDKGEVEENVINTRERTEPVQVKLLVENSCTTSAVSETLEDAPNVRENKKPASEIHKLPLVSQPSERPEKETEKGREPLVTCLKPYIQSEKSGCPVPEVASARTIISSLSSKKMGFTEPTLFEEKRERAQSDQKLVSLSMQYSKTELPQIQRQDSSMALEIYREVNNADGLDNGKKMNGSSTTKNKDTEKSKSVLRQRETSMKDLDALRSSRASFALEVNKIAAQSSGNPTTLANIPTSKNVPQMQRQESGMALKISREVHNADGLDNGKRATTQNEDKAKSKSFPEQRETSTKALDTLRSSRASFSLEVSNIAAHSSGKPVTLATIPTSKITPAQGFKISSIERGRKTPDLPGPKLQGLNLESKKSPIRKDIKPVGNIGLLRKPPSSTAHFPNSQKQTPPALSTKRKTVEGDAANIIGLHPSKRLMQSPAASSIKNVVDTSEKVLDKEVLYHSNMENKSIKSIVKSPVSTFHIPHATKINDVNMSFSIESNNNIKQAEAYAKELDNLCYMLKKKHDEAKELLVQAVVNSNKLLMLNNPLLDEKISFKAFYST
ncbi:hypothetical protein CASFOL_019326 [Castilleja foliolosa]|uniref:Uncharacterized protein n=1 Tax=Castilleja foliolosa TaxID=1961234 RepID=A0ABD3D5Q5_9LAMI